MLPKWLILLLITLGFAFNAHADSSITLKPHATHTPGQPIVLADVATLSGPEAKQYADMVIIPASAADQPNLMVLPQDIRAALSSQFRVPWARLTLSGRACKVGVQNRPASQTRVQRKYTRGFQNTLQADQIITQNTLRADIARQIASTLAIKPQDLRLSFRTRDAALLAKATASRRVEVRMLGSSQRTPLAITIYKNDSIVLKENLDVEIQVRKKVFTPIAEIKKGSLINQSDLHEQAIWLKAHQSPAILEQIVGSIARTRLKIAAPILADHIEPPIIVKRGDLVRIHCLQGSVIVKAQARALQAGRKDERIQFQSLTSRKTFYARMTSLGHAVMAENNQSNRHITIENPS